MHSRKKMTQHTGSAAFEILNNLLSQLTWQPHADGSIVPVAKTSWEKFNNWCDGTHVDCDPNDPEITSYDREI
jgi:hypothetical protein